MVQQEKAGIGNSAGTKGRERGLCGKNRQGTIMARRNRQIAGHRKTDREQGVVQKKGLNGDGAANIGRGKNDAAKDCRKCRRCG